MSQKNKLFNMDFFKYFILITYNFKLLYYFLDTKFILILPINNLYLKWELLDLTKFSKFILKSYTLHWMRVSFKGKGYRLRKFKKFNKVTLNFGHSHWARLSLLVGCFFFKKFKRQNYICIAKTYSLYKGFKNSLKFFKKLNSYTKRGLRLKKQFIRRRFGKISQVVSSLH